MGPQGLGRSPPSPSNFTFEKQNPDYIEVDWIMNRFEHLSSKTAMPIVFASGFLTGDLDFVPLRRARTHRNGTSGRFRWYNDYRLPTWAGAGSVTVRLHDNAEDDKRGLNRTENVRPIAADDPDFAKLYACQHVNLIGFAISVNSIAVHEHRRRDTAIAA
ncbi:MAG: hypothetical protein P8L46_02760 [Acidimicrobiales bacterium]|nr:hypothetical protein [Acidimicrobiales bacterium]MDG2216949.1 hypothetical protein [Acidimicrobiales bacterium]